MLDKLKKMFSKQKQKSLIDERIDEILVKMQNYDQYSDDYKSMADNLKTLSEVRDNLKDKRCRLDPNVILNGLFAFAQIIVILMYEERHVIRSKATSFMTRLIGRK